MAEGDKKNKAKKETPPPPSKKETPPPPKKEGKTPPPPKKKAAPKKKPAKKAPAPKAKKKPKVKEQQLKRTKAEMPTGKKLAKVPVFDAKGKNTGEVKLPAVFATPLRLDLIRRAVLTYRANRRQPYSPSPKAGMRHAVSTWGKGRGVARVQRLTSGSKAAESPPNVGGRRAHPPKTEKKWSRKMNRKEKKLARNSALAAAFDVEMVRNRGHKFDDGLALPLIFDDSLEGVEKTADLKELFENVGIWSDVERAKEGKHVRPGKGKARGRRYKTPRSILIVAQDPSKLIRSAGNLTGVDVITPTLLNSENLAPGGDPGRLTVFTKGSIKEVGKWQ